MPSSAPMKRIRLPGMRSFSRFATEMAGLIWPPVPPQVKTTFIGPSNQRSLLLLWRETLRIKPISKSCSSSAVPP